MGTNLNFRDGNLLPGMPLGNLAKNVTLSADNQVINPGLTSFLRLTSDNATASNRTFSLTPGSYQGQELFITVVGSATFAAELLSTGTAYLGSGTWSGGVGSSIHLMYDNVSLLWRELARTTVSASGIVTNGRYTPTMTLGANVSSASALSAIYSRMGNIVTVSGQTAVVATAAGNTASVIGVSLPIASNLATAADLSGAGSRLAATTVATSSVTISGDFTNDRAQLDFNSTQTTSSLLSFTFQYEVL